LFSPVAISENLGQHFNREIMKIVTAIDKLKANNEPKVGISLQILFSFNYVSL